MDRDKIARRTRGIEDAETASEKIRVALEKDLQKLMASGLIKSYNLDCASVEIVLGSEGAKSDPDLLKLKGILNWLFTAGLIRELYWYGG